MGQTEARRGLTADLPQRIQTNPFLKWHYWILMPLWFDISLYFAQNQDNLFHYVPPYNLSLLLQNSLCNRSKTLYILSKNSLHILSFNLSLYSTSIIKIILTNDLLGTNFTFFLVPFNAAFFYTFWAIGSKKSANAAKTSMPRLETISFCFCYETQIVIFCWFVKNDFIKDLT